MDNQKHEKMKTAATKENVHVSSSHLLTTSKEEKDCLSLFLSY